VTDAPIPHTLTIHPPEDGELRYTLTCPAGTDSDRVCTLYERQGVGQTVPHMTPDEETRTFGLASVERVESGEVVGAKDVLTPTMRRHLVELLAAPHWHPETAGSRSGTTRLPAGKRLPRPPAVLLDRQGPRGSRGIELGRWGVRDRYGCQRMSSAAKRHPLEVTSDRLADFLDKYGGQIDGIDRDMVSRVRHLLETLAEAPPDATS
jgi:hypothetical protein